MREREKQLIEKCQTGRPEHFAELYDAYVKKIYAFVYYRVSHRETAEDLTSEVFIKALDKIKHYSSDQGTFSSWLYAIARNTVIDHYRKNKNESDIDNLLGVLSRDDCSEEVAARMRLNQVGKYLKKFSPRQREIIIMRVWDGLSYKEISEITGMSQGGLKMTVSRILRKIRKESALSSLIIYLIMN